MVPLAEQLRPRILDDVIGQEHLTGENGFLRRLILNQKPLSLLFWGPPGCGKTTLAKLYGQAFGAKFISLSAVFSGVADLKKVIQEAEAHPLLYRYTILFVDEIHRFNKAQQDAFLPYVENGTLILVGATTENPSFALNKALLSRLRVLEIKPLDSLSLSKLIDRYESKKASLHLTAEAKEILVEASQGDGRYLLNLLENIEKISFDPPLNKEKLNTILQKRAAFFDKKGEQHYNLISALHKSIRGSDPDASLYWFSRIVDGGEEPLFIARRLIRMAVEDVGLADPEALKLAIAAKDAYEMLGSPEGELALAEVVLYLALAPKSNALYVAFNKAKENSLHTSHLSPPHTILNAPTEWMREQGYGKGYIYDPDTVHGFSGQDYFPEQLGRQHYYQPVERGFEREMKKRIAYFDQLRLSLSKTSSD